jgi:hypothetical protein
MHLKVNSSNSGAIPTHLLHQFLDSQIDPAGQRYLQGAEHCYSQRQPALAHGCGDNTFRMHSREACAAVCYFLQRLCLPVPLYADLQIFL